MIEGKVAKISTDTDIVVNKGREDGVERDMEFIVYDVGDVIEDPDTGEALGNVEHVKARVEPKHIQEKITVMTSAETEMKKTGIYSITTSGTKQVQKSIASPESEEFDNKVREGDLVRENVSR
jgi:hypothetical protein